MKAIYTAEATVSGGRDQGEGRTSDGALEVTYRVPAELGGPGEGTNPEQLFALGYGGCFENAIRTVARRMKVDVEGISVDVRVSLCAAPDRRFVLEVGLDVTLPSIEDPEQAVAIVAKAHETCPYSNATRDNVDVDLTANGRPVESVPA